jgi:deoxycytidylate deaminase
VHIYGFVAAQQVAQESDHYRHKVGAAVMRGTRLLSVGSNLKKTHPVMKGKTFSECLHAEVAAMLKVRDKKKLVGSTLYVYRPRRCGTPGLSMPCAVCLGIAYEWGVEKVHFTNPHSDTGFSTIPLDSWNEKI